MSTQLVLFDYDTLDAETRIVVKQRTTEIRDLMRNTAENIVRVGEKLVEVRDRLADGQFEAWIGAEFEWSRRTAYNFISVAEQFGARDFAQIDIATSALYLLAAPSTPSEVRQELIQRAEAGERITYSQARDTISQHKTRLEPGLPDMQPDQVAPAQAADRPASPPPQTAPSARGVVPQDRGPGLQRPEPPPDDGIRLDFSASMQVEADRPADVILTVRISRAAVGQLPSGQDELEISINAADGLQKGRFPNYYTGQYDDLQDLIEQACREYFASETEEVIEDE